MSFDTTFRSPNYSPRGQRKISMIVLHATVGTARSALAWLTNPRARVSAHYLIDKLGHVYQLVDDEFAAWHAGRALWRGETAINEMSIGIELENTNTGRDPYPQSQLDALTTLCRALVRRYEITPDMVVRHLDVAVPKGRKQDPAGFPMGTFLRDLFERPVNPVPERRPRPLPHPTEDREVLVQTLLHEAYHQVGASEWPGWAMGREAITQRIGLPVGASFEVTVDHRAYMVQSFGRDTLFCPVGEWRTLRRLSALTAAADVPLRDALVQAVYAQVGETYRADWPLHQVALRTPIGPPLTPSFRVSAGGAEFVAASYAQDTLVSPVGNARTVERLSVLMRNGSSEKTALAQELLNRLYRRAGSQTRPGWPMFQQSLHADVGAPLGPSFRISVGGRDYVAEAFALDVLFCEIGEWEAVQRLSALLEPESITAKV